MDVILQGLLDLAGVNAAMVFDGAGHLTAQRGKAVYDRALCEQVGLTLSRAVDSVQLQHQDWESITAQFADGKLLLRNLGPVGKESYVLAVVADGGLNSSFATVAIRVAATKLKKAIENPGGRTASAAGSSPALSQGGLASSAPPAASSSVHPAAGSRPALASSGLSWSKPAGSSVVFSNVAVADPASAAWLGRCSKELARFVGPMAKLYVEEAVRRISPEAPFSLAAGKALAQELTGHLDDPRDRAKFLQVLEGGGPTK
jgi:hypothetical protein